MLAPSPGQSFKSGHMDRHRDTLMNRRSPCNTRGQVQKHLGMEKGGGGRESARARERVGQTEIK